MALAAAVTAARRMWANGRRIMFHALCDIHDEAAAVADVAEDSEDELTFGPAGAPTVFVIPDTVAGESAAASATALRALAAALRVRVVLYAYRRVAPGALVGPTPEELHADVLARFDRVVQEEAVGPSGNGRALIIGVGVGSALAVHVLCARRPRVAGLCLVNSFSSVSDLLAERAAARVVWYDLAARALWWLEAPSLDTVGDVRRAFAGPAARDAPPVHLFQGAQNVYFSPTSALTLRSALVQALGDERVAYTEFDNWPPRLPLSRALQDAIRPWLKRVLA